MIALLQPSSQVASVNPAIDINKGLVVKIRESVEKVSLSLRIKSYSGMGIWSKLASQLSL